MHNNPQNVLSGEVSSARPERANFTLDDDMLLALSFSGGGMRAAAFSYGRCARSARRRCRRARGGGKLINQVDFVSGSSGGSGSGSVFRLEEGAILNDFRENFLLRNPEALNTDQPRQSRARSFRRLNEDTRLGVVERKSFKAPLSRSCVKARACGSTRRLSITTPFVFGIPHSMRFNDLNEFSVADAVRLPRRCRSLRPSLFRLRRGTRPLPPGSCAPSTTERQSDAACFRAGIAAYRDGSMRYVKLLDGGLVDNFHSFRLHHRTAGGRPAL